MHPFITRVLRCAPLLAIASCAPNMVPQPVPPVAPRGCQATDEQLIAALDAVHKKQKNVGLQAAIRIDGQLAFTAAIGLADRERGLPVTADTVFPVASITKAFTGIAALKANASGKLQLDVPVQTYVPEFPVKPEVTVTPRRLAAHRAGIRHWGPERDALYSRHFDRLQQILALFKDDPVLAKAGLEYQYSSYGYNLLGLAVERATGVEFTRYVRRQIIQPLGLSSTRFDDARKPVAAMSKLYSFYDLKSFAELPDPSVVPVRDYSHNMAGGNMSATATDLVNLGAALFESGFLPPAQHELLFVQPRFGGEPSRMSFGFFTDAAAEERRLSITGANPGMQAGLAIYPERRLAVSVLSNSWGIGSRSAEMVVDLPKQLADLCAPRRTTK